MFKNVIFDGNDIQTSNILLARIIDSGARRRIASSHIPHGAKSVISYVDYIDRRISLQGKIIGTSPANCEANVDTFKSYFNNSESNLDIDYNGTTRRYIATAELIDINSPDGLNYADFNVELLCAFPFGKNTSDTTILSDTARTDPTYDDDYTFGGTAPMQLPVITITYTDVLGGDNYVSVGNAETGQAITITDYTFVDGDILVIDCVNRKVTVNGIEIAKNGAFPEFKPGARTITYSDWFMAREFDIDIKYNPLYL